jgi:protoporphyrinogen oxidase
VNKLKTDILIIGAGPAGLACAYELTKAKRDFILVEKDGVVGGLAKTYEFNEEGLVFRTDNGPHRFFSENSDLYRLIEELLGNEWIKVRRQTRQFIDGKFYDYPVNFGQALKNIGLLKAGRMLADYARAKIEYGLFRKKIENFSDYVTANFGRTLGEFNMINYTEKIWGRKASEIHPDWAGQRIKGLDLISLVMNSLAGSLLRKGGDSPKTLVDVFYYPRAGTGSIYETIARRVRQADKMIMLDTEPMEIHHSHGRFSRTVLSSAGQTFEIEFDTLVESVPMKKFIELQRPQPDNSILDPNSPWCKSGYLKEKML